MIDVPTYLLDVNTAIALLDEEHVGHRLANSWFRTPGLRWALCAFTEAGLLRFLSRPQTGALSIREGTMLLEALRSESGYQFQAITADWETLVRPFASRLHGYKQVTDAYLLGLAIHEGLILATFDRAFLHLAGEHRQHVHLLA